MASDIVLERHGRPISVAVLHQTHLPGVEDDEEDQDQQFGTMNDASRFSRELCRPFERISAELGASCSRAKDQARELERQLGSTNAHVRDLERRLADEEESFRKKEEDHLQIVLHKNLLLSKAGEKVEKLQAQLDELQITMSESACEDWQKARLLKEQQQTLCDLHSSVDRLERKSESLKLSMDDKSGEVERERRLRKSAERKVEKLKKQLQSRRLRNEKDCGLLKAEICDLTESVKDIETERAEYERSLLQEKRRGAEKSLELRRLQEHANSVDAEKATTARLSNELSVCLADKATLVQQLQDKDAQLEHTEGDLETLRGSMRQVAAHMRGLTELHALSDHLKRLQTQQSRVCARDHHEYSSITDCGVLLCVHCLQEALPYDISNKAFTPGSQVDMELDCRWCGAECWTWQPLPIAYSTGWIVEWERLSSAVRCTLPRQA